MEAVHSTGLLSDSNDVVMRIDLLEAMIIHLGDLLAEHAQVFKRRRLVWTTLEVRLKLLAERLTPVNVRWRSTNLVDSATLVGFPGSAAAAHEDMC